jgi:hypothetical protein
MVPLPRSLPPVAMSLQLVQVFETALPSIDSAKHDRDSNSVGVRFANGSLTVGRSVR